MTETPPPDSPYEGRSRLWSALYALGIHWERTGRWNFSIRFRKRFFYISGAFLLFGFVSLLGLAKYSESPTFCHSCHIMHPYYNAWKSSKHNKVDCVECHYPPASPKTLLWKKFQALSQVAKYVTRTYSSKPFAEVEDAACLKCHSTRLLEGKLVTKRGIRFDHRAHLTTTRRERKLACTSCHGQVMIGNHMEVTWNTCYLCHFKGMREGREFHPIGGCLACHELPTKDFQIGNMVYNHKEYAGKRGVNCLACHQDVVQGSGDAPKERCFTCHNQPEKLARYNDMPFLHENHVTKHHVACFHCHTDMQHKVSAPGKKELTYDCSVCHLNKHMGQKDFYRGTGARGVPEMPSPMYLANVDCVGCHTAKSAETLETHFKGQTFKAPAETACQKCHGPAYAGITANAKKVIGAELELVESKLSQARAQKGKAAGAGAGRDLERTLADAEYNLAYLRAAHAVHNIYYAAQILRRTDRMLSDSGAKYGMDLPDISDRPLMSGGFCATMCHQQLKVKVPPEFVIHGGKKMPHLAHAQMMSCTKCHEFESHKVVKKIFKKQDCEACHAN